MYLISTMSKSNRYINLHIFFSYVTSHGPMYFPPHSSIGSPNRTRKGKLVSTTHTIVEISSEGTFGCRLPDQ